jgi:uncharacterized protein
VSGPGTAPTRPAMLRGTDLAAFAVAFAVRLRQAGLSVGVSAIESFTRGLAAVRPGTVPTLYWVGRATLVQREADMGLFDAVFDAVFAGAVLPLDPNARRGPLGAAGGENDGWVPRPGPEAREGPGEGLPWSTLPAAMSPATDAGEEPALRSPERLPSALEQEATTPFEALAPEHLAVLDEWLTGALRHWPSRRSRRMAPHYGGRAVSVRSTMARARRTGFDPAVLVRTEPLKKPRRVVMLCDVSQSMQPYAAAYFHLMRAAAVATRAEVFAFATVLTRLTPVLAHGSADAAVQQATAKVLDRFGGTRIATNVRALLASRHGDACRGAIVLIASDGWDSDPPEALAAAMARLRRRAHRVIWMNPRVSAPGFVPLVGAMAASLPYCDELLAADSIQGLSKVVDAIVGSA